MTQGSVGGSRNVNPSRADEVFAEHGRWGAQIRQQIPSNRGLTTIVPTHPPETAERGDWRRPANGVGGDPRVVSSQQQSHQSIQDSSGTGQGNAWVGR